MIETGTHTHGARRSGAPDVAQRSALEVPVASADARELFGARLPLAQRYAETLAGDGVGHGHLGPREVPVLWSRHLVNSALVADLLPVGSTVVDVGSGAGLPGIPLAIRRPDLTITLLEPMQRRVLFLQRCVDELGLGDQVRVVRGRADDGVVRRSQGRGWVVARAVAPLGRLVSWCLPLVSSSGRLLALKGLSAADEVVEHEQALADAGAGVERIAELGQGQAATRVVVVARVAGGTTNRRVSSVPRGTR